jgi:hypothetical protein
MVAAGVALIISVVSCTDTACGHVAMIASSDLQLLEAYNAVNCLL